MNPLERLENLATELIGRGAAISLDSARPGWVGTAWNAAGVVAVQVRGVDRSDAIRCLMRALRERSIDQPVEPWTCWAEGCYLAVDQDTGCCEMHGLPPENGDDDGNEENQEAAIEKGEQIDWGYED